VPQHQQVRPTSASSPQAAGTGPKVPWRPPRGADAPDRQKRPKTTPTRKWRPARIVARTIRAGRRFREMLSEERFSAVFGRNGAPPAPVTRT